MSIPRVLPSPIVAMKIAIVTMIAFNFGCGRHEVPTVASAPHKPKKLPIVARGKSSLSGKITHGGRPIVAGRLCFFSGEGLVPTAGVISPLGTYKAEGLTPGDHWICVLLDPTGRLPFPESPNLHVTKSGSTSKRASNRKPNPPPGVAVKSTPRDADSAPWTEVPPPILTAFRNYTVPKPLQSTYTLLHGQYGRLGANNPLKCVLQDGENVLDIVLP